MICLVFRACISLLDSLHMDNSLRILGKIKKGLSDLTEVDNDVNDAYSNGIANGFSVEFLVIVEV